MKLNLISFLIKKTQDLSQAMSLELEKLKGHLEKQKLKLEKAKKKSGVKYLKSSKSSLDFDSVSPQISEISTKSNLELTIENFNSTVANTREKYTKQMIEVYEDTYKSIKDIKISSIQPVKNI